MKKFDIRKLGEESWGVTVGCDLYEAAENYVEEIDENGDAWSNGIVFEIREQGSEKVNKVQVFASVSYSAYDFEAKA